MTELRQRMIHDMRIRNYSPRTIEVYTYHVGCFAKFCGQSPLKLGPEQIRDYQVHLVETKNVSWSSFNQAVCALRFLYRTTIPRDWPVTMIPFAKNPKKLPTVLGYDEVRKLLSCAYPLKHRTVLTVLYAAGLRLEEALHLKCTDVDSARMLLRVSCGKGAKERLVPFSPRLLECLRDYWKDQRPTNWMFPGSQPERRLDSTVVQKCCRRAATDAGLNKHATPHTLRHSYATGLLEAGVDLLTLSRLLGHRSFSTTLIYLHVRRPHLESVPSPFDWLPVDQCPKVCRSHQSESVATGGSPARGGRAAAEIARGETAPQEGQVEPSHESRLRVTSILRKYGPDSGPFPRLSQRRVLAELSACRTPAMGSYSHQCEMCGHESFGGHNSCRNRHCPTCGGPTRAHWLDRVRQDVLPVVYFHFVFTLPARLSPLVRVNEKCLYNLLFRTAWRTLKQLAKDPKRLGGQLGAIMALHTWNQQLGPHPHVHCVIPGGVLSPTGSWISAPISQRTGKPYLLPVQVVSRLFRGKFLAGLKRLHRKGELKLPTELAHLSDDRAWNRFLTPMYCQEWVVHGEGPPQGILSGGPDAILKYLARYVAGAAISDRRLIADDGQNVTFWAREPKKPGSRCKPKQIPVSLPGPEFVQRFLMHVLPRGFQRVRYYGLLSNRHRGGTLAQVRALLGNSQHAENESGSAGDVAELPTCPHCGIGVLRVVQGMDTPVGWVWILLSSPYALRSDWDYWGDRVKFRQRSRGDPPRCSRQKKAA